MRLEGVSAIRLEEAFFCLNCEVVTNCSDICPACGHSHLWLLENWLGRINGTGEKEMLSRKFNQGQLFPLPRRNPLKESKNRADLDGSDSTGP